MGDRHPLLARALSPDHLDDLPSASETLRSSRIAPDLLHISGLS
jgi:hypothetical protein